MNIDEQELKRRLRQILLSEFSNNQYFDFLHFFNIVQSTLYNIKVSYDTVRYFIYDMIDEKVIEQVYTNENSSTFLRRNGNYYENKTIHFKIIVAITDEDK